jgi:hypothetical protein
MSNPSKAHFSALNRIWKYLNYTKDKSLVYKLNNNLLLLGYSDADWGGDLITRRSTTGNIFYLGSNLISWLSTLQKTVALSTCEAEYMALKEAVKESLWLYRFITFIDNSFKLKLNTNIPKILCDNEAAIKLAENPEFHKRSKHIDITYHFIRETVQNKEIQLVGVKTREQKANGFTKPLDKYKQEELQHILQIK